MKNVAWPDFYQSMRLIYNIIVIFAENLTIMCHVPVQVVER